MLSMYLKRVSPFLLSSPLFSYSFTVVMKSGVVSIRNPVDVGGKETSPPLRKHSSADSHGASVS